MQAIKGWGFNKLFKNGYCDKFLKRIVLLKRQAREELFRDG